jgi:hypothetical protein
MAQMAAFAAGLDEKQSLESYDAYAGAAVSANDYTSSQGAPVLDFTSSSGSGAPPPARDPALRPAQGSRGNVPRPAYIFRSPARGLAG